MPLRLTRDALVLAMLGSVALLCSARGRTHAQVLAVGGDHSCAVTTDGGMTRWGQNGYGQLGDGTTIDRHTAVDVTGLTSGVTAAAAGVFHTCALMSGGGVKCWGWNTRGALGNGTTTERDTPGDVKGLTSGAGAVAAGYSHTCAVMTGGGLKCWGSNSEGQLGDGTTTDRHTPVDVAGLASTVEAVTGGFAHTCALTTGGGVQCWGRNDSGQLGDGTTTFRLYTGGCDRADERHGDGRRRPGPHLRRDDQWRGEVLGVEPLWPAGRRHDDGPPYAGGCGGSHERRGGIGCLRQPHLRADDGGGGEVLGRQRQRRVGRRHDNHSPDANRNDRADELRVGSGHWYVPHLRPDGRRGGLVHGCRRQRPAGRRRHDQEPDAGAGARLRPERHPWRPRHRTAATNDLVLPPVRTHAASSASVSLIGTSTPSSNRAARTSSPFIASMNFLNVPM